VAAGETLLVLGDVGVAADVNRLNYRVLSERAGLTRLEAEQLAPTKSASGPNCSMPPKPIRALAEQLAKERALFDARRDALQGQTSLLRAQRDKNHPGGHRPARADRAAVNRCGT
jgi:hypothetical protein